jgi:hypothetical protein
MAKHQAAPNAHLEVDCPSVRPVVGTNRVMDVLGFAQNDNRAVGSIRVPPVFRDIPAHELRMLLSLGPWYVVRYDPKVLLALPERYETICKSPSVGGWDIGKHKVKAEGRAETMSEAAVSIVLKGCIGIMSFAITPWVKESKKNKKSKQEFQVYFGLVLTKGSILNELRFLSEGHRGRRDQPNVLAFTMRDTTLLHIPFSTLALMANQSPTLRRNITLCAVEKSTSWHGNQRQATPGDVVEKWSSTLLRLLSRYGTFGYQNSSRLKKFRRICVRLDAIMPLDLLRALTGDFESARGRRDLLKEWSREYVSTCKWQVKPIQDGEAKEDQIARDNQRAKDMGFRWYALSALVPEDVANILMHAKGFPDWQTNLTTDMLGNQAPIWSDAIRHMLRCASFALVHPDEHPDDVHHVYEAVEDPEAVTPPAMDSHWQILKPKPKPKKGAGTTAKRKRSRRVP